MNTRSALSAFPRQKYNTLHDVIWWLKSPQPWYNEKKGLLRAKLAKIEQNCLVNKKAFYNSASKTSFRRHLPLYYQNKKRTTTAKSVLLHIHSTRPFQNEFSVRAIIYEREGKYIRGAPCTINFLDG